jgi:formate dehydrogenase major subunit
LDISRRGFFKLSALAAGTGGLTSGLGFDLTPAHAALRDIKISSAREHRTICPYCAVGCGAIAYVRGSGGVNTVSDVIHVEGDPDNPINRGTLCPKGAAQMQLAANPRLRRSPLLRDAGSLSWREVTWDFAMDWLARRFKDSRDETFVERDPRGRTVNRCDGIAWVGSATVANEDAYLIVKAMRAMGLIYLDHQARI